MKMKLRVRRDFLKQAGLMGSFAMMAGLSEGTAAFGGRGSVVEDAVFYAHSSSSVGSSSEHLVT
jgi:hypothetical protein